MTQHAPITHNTWSFADFCLYFYKWPDNTQEVLVIFPLEAVISTDMANNSIDVILCNMVGGTGGFSGTTPPPPRGGDDILLSNGII